MASLFSASTASPIPTTDGKLCRWIGDAMPGDRLVYHQGFLTVDVRDQHLPGSARKELRRLAVRAQWAAAQGLIDLVQIRHGPDQYSYVAVARLRRLSNP